MAGGPAFGSLWASRPPEAGLPDRIETRLLALAADQVALAVQRDTLRAQAVEAEVARRDAALKSALVDSVSHDLRTPLAGIRAAAGSIADPDTERTPDEVRATATSIETEAIRLDRMVGALLDLSRIQAGAIHARREALDVEDAAGAVIDRLRRCSASAPSTSPSARTCRRSRPTRRSSTSVSPTSSRTRRATRRPHRP